MKFIAHRGESMDAPENTMASFRLAWERDAVGIEGDFYKLTDGRIACMHDQNAKRTCGVDVDICTINYAELNAFDAGSFKGAEWAGEKAPLLDDIFREMPASCAIYAEVKDDSDGIIEAIKDLAEKYKITSEQLIIISFSEAAIVRASEVLPKSKRYLLTGLKETDSGFSPTADEMIEKLKDLYADGVDCCCNPLPDRDYVSKVQAAGLEFHIWTVNDVENAQRMIDAGVDSITSDCAAKLRNSFA